MNQDKLRAAITNYLEVEDSILAPGECQHMTTEDLVTEMNNYFPGGITGFTGGITGFIALHTETELEPLT